MIETVTTNPLTEAWFAPGGGKYARMVKAQEEVLAAWKELK